MKEQNNVAVTSVKQIPGLFKWLDWESGTVNFDLGGGKYDLGTEYLKEQGVTNLIYDIFNRSQEHNDAVILAASKLVDTVTLSNLLCVVEVESNRTELLMIARSMLKYGGKVYISCYEGDKSGVGKVTRTGSYQANRKLRTYMNEIEEVFDSVEYKGKYIVGVKMPQEREVFLG